MDNARVSSSFRFYSLGIAASNLELNSVELEVSPIEHLPMLEGELSQLPSGVVARGSDSVGSSYQEELQVASSVRASWRSIGSSNRMTPPNVRRGEELILYQVGDSDKYYWDTINNLGGLRKLETVVYAFSGTKGESVVELNPDNSYVLEISTHEGRVKLTTSKANGEPFAYSLEVDAKNGKLEFKDDVGNEVLLNSEDKRVKLLNGDGSLVDVVGKAISLMASDSVTIKTKQFSVSAPTTTIQGNTQIAGNFNTIAGPDGDGVAEFDNDIRTKRDVIASGVSLVKHRHRDSGGSGIGGEPV